MKTREIQKKQRERQTSVVNQECNIHFIWNLAELKSKIQIKTIKAISIFFFQWIYLAVID